MPVMPLLKLIQHSDFFLIRFNTSSRSNFHDSSFFFSDTNVLLGTRQGHLLMYSLRPHATENKTEPQLLQYDKNFSKKAIVQLEVIPEYKLLFSLSDGIINVNDISQLHFPNVHTAVKTKGATTFALDVKVSSHLS
jgi:Vam6/Vps39-like protein vacuolar protein sorting-associated protein 39